MLLSFGTLRALRIPLLAVLALALSAGLSPAQQSGFTVRGTVLDSVTKQPIARALVQLDDNDAMLTDVNGNFEFTGVQTQGGRIQVRRPGYVSNIQSESMSLDVPVSSFFVALSSSMAPLQLLLTPEAILIGQISLPNSEPASRVRVSAYRKGVENGRPMWRMAGNAVTNSEGIFRIASLPAGSYLLYVRPHADRPTAPGEKPFLGYASVYFPGATDASGAGVISLATGEHQQIYTTLLRQTFYPVSIHIANAEPGKFVSVEIRDSGGQQAGSSLVYDSQKQTTRMDLPNGRYVLNARMFRPGFGSQFPLLGHAEFSVSGRPAYLDVSIFPMAAIPVILREEFTAAGTRPTYRLAHSGSNNPNINLSFVPAGVQFLNEVFGNRVEAAPGSNDGSSLQLEGVPPGKYWVEARTYGAYVSSISSGGDDLSQTPITIGAGGSSAPIEITLRDDTGTLNGTISRGPGSSGGETPRAWIYAIPLFSTVSELPSTISTSAGKFTFYALAPGAYRVIACDSPHAIAFHTSEGVAAWAGKGRVVTLEPGGTAHVELDVAPTAEGSE